MMKYDEIPEEPDSGGIAFRKCGNQCKPMAARNATPYISRSQPRRAHNATGGKLPADRKESRQRAAQPLSRRSRDEPVRTGGNPPHLLAAQALDNPTSRPSSNLVRAFAPTDPTERRGLSGVLQQLETE